MLLLVYHLFLEEAEAYPKNCVNAQTQLDHFALMFLLQPPLKGLRLRPLSSISVIAARANLALASAKGVWPALSRIRTRAREK